MKKFVIVIIIICLSVFAITKIVEASENQPVSPNYAKGYEDGYEQALEDVKTYIGEEVYSGTQNGIDYIDATRTARRYSDNKTLSKELREALDFLSEFPDKIWFAICDLDDILEPEYKEE